MRPTTPSDFSLVDLLLIQIHLELQKKELGDVLVGLAESLALRRFQTLGLPEHRVDIEELCRLGAALDPNANDELSHHRSCLSISLTLALIAESVGIPAKVTIGVFHDGGRLYSHAWLTLPNDRIIDTGSQSQRFEPICQFLISEWDECFG